MNNKPTNQSENQLENQSAEKSEAPKSSYPKGARIIAGAGAVLLVLMYLVTLVAALTASPSSGALFKACLGGSILLPIMLWLYIRFAKLWSQK